MSNCYYINAKNLGPVRSLNCELSRKRQNVVFARNGTGKSFLSRAFRYLDLYGQGKPIADAQQQLVSDEAEDGSGEFEFGHDGHMLGSLTLKSGPKQSTAKVQDTIFHVFSEDFVQSELRERDYNPNGDFQGSISVSSENIEHERLEAGINSEEQDENTMKESLSSALDNEANDELIKRAGVNRRLAEFKDITLEALLSKHYQKSEQPSESLEDVIRELKQLNTISDEPTFPEAVGLISLDEINFPELAACLERETSLSSISHSFKQKINEHKAFIRAGVSILKGASDKFCPFCEQSITSPGPQGVIDAYIEYFEDSEAKHKDELDEFSKALDKLLSDVKETRSDFIRQKSRFNELNSCLPEVQRTSLDDTDILNDAIDTLIENLKRTIVEKQIAINSPIALPEGDLENCIATINQSIEESNRKFWHLKNEINNVKKLRTTLHRKACKVFMPTFVCSHWTDFEKLRKQRQKIVKLQNNLDALEQSFPSEGVRDRVRITFDALLKTFFGTKYTLDKSTFTLRLNYKSMKKGPRRTLSEGEKTVIAFCYFVACVHTKVKTGTDYSQLYLVFDDPITSLSFDFVYSITQTLRMLRISKDGVVKIGASEKKKSECTCPQLLILTHSGYFFNLLLSNRVVEKDAAFSLSSGQSTHEVVNMREHISPFRDQLRHVLEVTKGSTPDHSTANSIRSVLEAIALFCRPDKSSSLNGFINHLAREDGIEIRGTLINSLSHGSYYEETLTPADLKMACVETLKVVEKYAFGQLAVLGHETSDRNL